MAADDGRLVLADAQRFALGNADLHFDQVIAAHGFGNGVLHLQARIDFHKIKFFVLRH